MHKLTIYRKASKTDEISLTSENVSIGRDESNGIVINDPAVSRRHAKISLADNRWIIEDLNSTNGTCVNGRPVVRKTLQPGDKISIGDCEIHFALQAGACSDYSASESTIAFYRGGVGAQAGQNHAHGGKAKQGPATGERIMAWLVSLVPILSWLPNYDRADLKNDLVAGITVTAMLIPQGMAYALLAGLPPIYGLYASVAPPLVYAIFGTSRQLSVAPVALDSLLVAAGVGVIATVGSDQYILLVILLAAMVGLIQLLMGIARMGFIVNFLSYPVLTGFITAAALIIGFSQLKHLLGLSLPQTYFIPKTLYAAAEQVEKINYLTLLIGIGSILVIRFVKHIHKRIPGAITAVVLATLVVWLFGLDRYGVQIVGKVPAGLPSPGLPQFNTNDILDLLPIAFAIAIVGFSEAIAVAKVYASKNNYRIDANQELIALGMSNLAGSLLKGYPVSGGVSRSAVNAQSGSRTPLASIITALLIILALLVLTPAFYYLPKAVLAAVIISAVASLIDTDEIKYLFRVKKSEGLVLVLTTVATLGFGIIEGLVFGVVCSILLFITLNTRPNAAILGRLPGTNIFRNIENYPEAEQIEGLIILRIDASYYFANTEFLKDKLYEIVENCDHPLKAIILDAGSINDLDSSANKALHEIAHDYKKRRIELYIAGLKAPIREVMKRSKLYEVLGADHFFFTIDAAVRRYQTTHPSR